MEIKNKRCLVTGAARGLGKQIALDLIRNGACVHVCDISEDALKGIKDATGDLPVFFHVCDVAEESSVKAMFAEIAEAGPLDVLVNNAGITRDGLFLKASENEIRTMSLESFKAVIDVNLTGVFLCAREAAVVMSRNGGGVIINMSSVSRAGNFGQTNYSAAKAGVDAMTVTWSKELARYNIRCAAIAPGYIGTEMVKSINPGMMEKIVAQIPLKRLGEPAEISKTVQFIIENDFVNGRTLEIDGGLRI